MNERIQALRGRRRSQGCLLPLPNGVLGIISMYDCHPTASLMKAVTMKRWERCGHIPPGMEISVDEPHYMNSDWGRICCKGFYFYSWKYSTHPDIIYLPDWAVEEYLEERLAAWLDRGEWKQ